MKGVADSGGESPAPESRPANAGKPWSLDEQNALVGRFRDGATIALLAAEFGRSTGGIRSRLQRLGLIEPS